MIFSQRILQIKPSATLEINALANALKAKGYDIIGFGAGEPDFDTPEFIKKAGIRAIENGKTKYTPTGGIDELKEAIVKKFKKDNDLEYNKANVIVNCGGKHSFYNLMQVLLNNDDEVIITAPYWVSYPPMVMLAGGKPVIIEASEENEFKVTSGIIKKAITNKTRAIVLNSPSNPTGAVYTMEELKDLADLLAQYDILVISDDIYEALLYDNKKFYNIANMGEEIKKKTVVLNGVSKPYSMTGWRIGYMAGDENLIKKVDILQSQSTSNPASISQWAALEALSGDQTVVREMAKVFERRRNLIVEKLNSIKGINCKIPGGAFYAFPNISGIFKFNGWKSIIKKYDSKNNSSLLASYLLEEAKVAVVPGIEFGSDNNIRLSFATSDENITNGIGRIKEAVEKLI
ncbi:MAG: pyridoxal phosphate-dependent aminotransferase [Spirochaetota bacterium]